MISAISSIAVALLVGTTIHLLRAYRTHPRHTYIVLVACSYNLLVTVDAYTVAIEAYPILSIKVFTILFADLLGVLSLVSLMVAKERET